MDSEIRVKFTIVQNMFVPVYVYVPSITFQIPKNIYIFKAGNNLSIFVLYSNLSIHIL